MLDITESRQLEKKVREAARLERERLRADLHDGLGQELTGLSLALAALRQEVDSANVPWVSRLEQLRTIAANAIITCRTIVHGLSPVAKSGGGLISALQLLVTQSGRSSDPTVKIDITEESPVQLDEAAADHIYRIAQEGIRNAIKHSHATSIRVTVTISQKTFTLEVFDNGIGSRSKASCGHGLDIMRYRAREIHGQVAVVRSRSGTRLRCTCPNVAM